MATGVREAAAADRDAIAAMLGRAFANDPAMSYIFPDPAQRARRLPRLFALLFDEDAGGLRLVKGDADAATLWQPPGRTSPGLLRMLAHAVPLIGALGTAIPRALRVADAIEAHAPTERHWYLHVAGVDPAMQGRGLGKGSIRDGLARIAGDRVPTYLETATHSNLGLYQSLGFAVTGEWHVPKGGPRFWSMVRPA